MGLYPKVEVNHPSGLPEHPHGNVFYVNYQEGTDTTKWKQGTKASRPFETITYALAQCSDDDNDIIYVTTVTQLDTQPVIINKRAVQIIGLPNNMPGYANQARCWMYPDAHVLGGVFTISAGDVVIKNMMLWGTAGQPCIDFGVEATGVRQVISQCSFHAGSYGVMTGPAANQPSHYLGIIDNHFGPTLSTGGILHASNGSWPVIADNFFESISMPNISVTGGMAGGRIHNNTFMLPADSTVGGAIDLALAPTRWWVTDNKANDASNDALTANPYRDLGVDNAWAGNVVGGDGFTEQDPA